MIKQTFRILTFSFIIFSLVSPNSESTEKQPKTVRDYFLLLPAKYFPLELVPATKENYLEHYLLIEDNANGYMSGDSDAAQEGFEMALFKKKDKTHIIVIATTGEGDEESYSNCFFLNYSNGKWTDISNKIVPEYNPKIFLYKLPRYGTTIKVESKENNPEKKSYDLIWKDDSFHIRNIKLKKN